MLRVPNVIVSCEWLNENLSHKDLVLLDATIPKVTNKKQIESSSKDMIPGARFFDTKLVFSNIQAKFPNTMISSEVFEIEVQKLGIDQNSCVVIYDSHGIYSSPRAWWMFRSMGFDNVAVLNGGLPEWKSLSYVTKDNYQTIFKSGDFKCLEKNNSFVDYQFVLNSLLNKEVSILDARSKGRFEGSIPEPREGVRSGHIPNSKNLPYSSLLIQNKIHNQEDLINLFQKVATQDQQLILSCGTGITACILALGATIAQYKNISVYDGSWTEWGSLLDLPIKL